MASDTTDAFATRLTRERAEKFKQAVTETDVSRSDLLARAARYYMDENPDQIPVFRSGETEEDWLAEAGILPPQQ